VEGLYKVEYDISGGTGRSVLYAHAGTMLGGNTAFAHFGTYENVDGEIIARLRTRRHSPSPHRRNLVSANAVTISIRGRAGRRLALREGRYRRRRIGVRGHDAARQ
jgi:hypothetical protein